jgi:hypothetical protein
MHSIASSITAVALLAHAILGCCSHHAHVAEIDARATVGSAAVECCHEHSCDEHAGANALSAPSDSDHQHHKPCDEVDCSFAGGDARMTVDSPLAGLALPVIDAATRLMSGSASRRAADIAPERLPSAALFVLQQRLVI